ncbi:MAG: hypothetical protein P8M72_04535 [Gammaproteobacteria bacterium]|nr:hypothetical protein [Gammaproteobacteria bacterium]
MDKIVEAGIETAGTSTLGTSVEVGSVELDLVGGTASIYDFSIANPVGFSNASMVSFEELSVSINLQNTSGDQIHINSVVARSPFVLYESVEGETNVDAVSARFDSEADVTEESDDSAAINLIIDSIVIEDIQATLISGFLPEPVDVGLGDILLNDLEGSPDDIAGQIMTPILAQVGSAAAQALVQATADILSNATEGAQDALEGFADQASEALEGVGNLFKRD